MRSVRSACGGAARGIAAPLRRSSLLLGGADARQGTRGVRRSGVQPKRARRLSPDVGSVVGKTAQIYIRKTLGRRSAQISPGTNTAGTFFLYAAQSSPYLSEQKWSSRTARWMSSTAK